MFSQFSKKIVRRISDEGGAALVVVLALSITMLILITAALSFSLSGMKVARTDTDNSAAIAAAYAGIDEYSSRLSNDSKYYRFGNPAAPLTIQTGSDSTVTLPVGADTNKAFGLGKTGDWAPIVGSDGRASFRYEVDNSQYSSSGVLRLRSTGRVGNQTASVIANLKQKGFIDFLYYTKYEIKDPLFSSTDCVPGYGYISGGSVRHASDCSEINFRDTDTLNGPVHSNDIMRICGTTFTGKVTTSSTLALNPLYVKTGSNCADNFKYGNGPTWAPELDMPPTNTAMATEAQVDLPDINRPGCMYTGPTSITFLADGRVNVISPWTKVTQPSLTAGIPSQSPASCGKLADLQSPAGATFPVPQQNLMFVQKVQGDSSNPNYTKAGTVPNTTPKVSCLSSGPTSGWKFGTLAYPVAGEVTADMSKPDRPAYDCRHGDAFVKGVVHGQVTVASDNYIYITDDITYADKAKDVLGLVGAEAVWVWDPLVKSCNWCSTNPLMHKNRTIYAAILTTGHTFQVQNYALGGDRGTLKVVGAIAQIFRGTVGANGTDGYEKDYNYDTRLFAISPPKFLTPTSTTYGVTKYALVNPAFDSTGVAR